MLVVDSEQDVRDLVATSLRFAGFEVHTAADGVGALRVTRHVDPDLAVLDVTLPDMDGFTLARRLRKRAQRVPVVFLAGRADYQDEVACVAIEGDDHLTKPFSLDEVVARIRAVLRRTQPGTEIASSVLACADLELDENCREVTRSGQVVNEASISHLRRKVDAITAADGSAVAPLLRTKRSVGYMLRQTPS